MSLCISGTAASLTPYLPPAADQAAATPQDGASRASGASAAKTARHPISATPSASLRDMIGALYLLEQNSKANIAFGTRNGRRDGDAQESQQQTSSLGDLFNNVASELGAGTATADTGTDTGCDENTTDATNGGTWTPVTQGFSFSNSLKADGFSISASADGENGTYSVVIDGPNGFQTRETNNGLGGSGSATTPGWGLAASQNGSLLSLTLSQYSAEQATVTETSSAGTVSASVDSVQSDALTFAVNFATGAIEIAQSDKSVTTTTAQVDPSAASLSTLA